MPEKAGNNAGSAHSDRKYGRVNGASLCQNDRPGLLPAYWGNIAGEDMQRADTNQANPWPLTVQG